MLAVDTLAVVAGGVCFYFCLNAKLRVSWATAAIPLKTTGF